MQSQQTPAHPEFNEIFAALCIELNPTGPMETFYVRQMADAQWRLARLSRLETGFLDHESAAGAKTLGEALFSPRGPAAVASLSAQENSLHRAFHRAAQDLRHHRSRHRA